MPFTPFDFNDEWASAWEWARMYRALGWQVTPAHTPHAGQWKRPAVQEWVEFQVALVPDSLFARWYDPNTGEHRQRRNMGVIVLPPVDPAEGWVFVVDLDVGEGKNGLGWWNGLVAVHANGLEPETVSQITGGGGRQMLFRGPPGWIPPTNKVPSLGVDFRGKGGFWMAPPSMHASGRIYDWEPGREPWSVDVADAEPWLIAAIDELVKHASGSAPTGEKTATPEAVKNAFGLDVDGREAKLAAIAWALVVDFRRASDALPSVDDLARETLRAWTQYEVTTKSRLEPRPGHSNSDLLELEGRGWTELQAKIGYALGQWDGKVAEAAKVPKLSADPPDLGGEFDSESPRVAGSWVSVTEFHGDPPTRRWLVPGWVPEGELCSLYGAGGAGKSLIALQLAYSMVLGEPWLGLETLKASSLYVSCEDDRAELERRHAAIKAGLGHGIGNPFDGVTVWPRRGENNLLASPDGKGGLCAGPFTAELRNGLEILNPRLLILDTLADVFGGNEVDRVQVNFFLKTLLGGLILEREAQGHSLTVLLLGHPSVSGMAEGGRGFSGSTAWENGVRTRLYLSKPENAGPDERMLSRGKANYAGGDDGELALLWGQGVFLRVDPNGGGVDQMARTIRTEVRGAWDIGAPYVEKRGHPRYLHSAILKRLTMPGQPRELVQAGLRAAIDEGLIYASRTSAKRGWRAGDSQ